MNKSKLEKEFSKPSLTAEEKAMIYDLQCGLWSALRESGNRRKYNITSLVLYATAGYTGEFDELYKLTGLGEPYLTVELTLTFADKEPESSIAQIDRNDNEQMMEVVGGLLNDILKRNF